MGLTDRCSSRDPLDLQMTELPHFHIEKFMFDVDFMYMSTILFIAHINYKKKTKSVHILIQRLDMDVA